MYGFTAESSRWHVEATPRQSAAIKLGFVKEPRLGHAHVKTGRDQILVQPTKDTSHTLFKLYSKAVPLIQFNPYPAPGCPGTVVGTVHGRRDTRSLERPLGAPPSPPGISQWLPGTP